MNPLRGLKVPFVFQNGAHNVSLTQTFSLSPTGVGLRPFDIRVRRVVAQKDKKEKEEGDCVDTRAKTSQRFFFALKQPAKRGTAKQKGQL